MSYYSKKVLKEKSWKIGLGTPEKQTHHCHKIEKKKSEAGIQFILKKKMKVNSNIINAQMRRTYFEKSFMNFINVM